MGACRGYFPRQGEKKPWNACGASAQGFEFAAVNFDNWLPLVRSFARRAMGIQECKPSLAEDIAFRRKAQGIASTALLGAAQNAGIICWKSGAVDALFPCGKGGGAGVAHGYKGKGILIHLLVDADGMLLSACSSPANGDERKYVSNLLETVAVKTGKAGRPRKNVRRMAADKGYALRNFR